MTRNGHWLCTAAIVLMRVSPLSKYSFEPLGCSVQSQGVSMQRREFITLLGGAGAAWPLTARAQQARVYPLGVLTLPNPEPLLKALREGLRDAGYVEGGNLRLEIRSAAGRPDLQLDKAAELVRLKVDLIVTFFTPSALAAKQATRDIPIVMAGAGDPVATGLL